MALNKLRNSILPTLALAAFAACTPSTTSPTAATLTPTVAPAERNYSACKNILALTEDDAAEETPVAQTLFPEAEKKTTLDRFYSGETMERFSSLGPQTQQKIISMVDKYFLTQTNLGIIVSEVLESVKVDSEEKPQLTDTMEYNLLKKKIYYFNPSPELIFLKYFQGSTILSAKAHESIHAHQDQNSSLYEFRGFLGKHVYQAQDDEAIDVNLEMLGEFRNLFMPQDDSSYDETLTEFKRMVELQNDNAEEILVREIQAYVLFEPYSAPGQLYRFLRDSGIYNGILEKVPEADFNSAFNATIRLIGMVDTLKTAEFGGRHGSRISEYVSAVSDLQDCLGFTESEAYNKGIGRQDATLFDIQAVSVEADRLLMREFHQSKRA